MNSEQRAHAQALADRALPEALQGIDSFAAAVAAYRRFGGFAEVLALSAGALFAKGETYAKEVDLLLDAVPPTAWETPGAAEGLYAMLLYRRGTGLSLRHRHRLEEFFEDSLSHFLQPCYDFAGANDCAPTLVTAYLFLYGEQFGSASALATANRRLALLERILEDRDCLSEWFAPNALGRTLHALAAAVNLCEQPETKSRLRKCESVLWRTAASMLDRQGATLMGPYGVAEEEALRGGTGLMRLLLEILLGDRLPIRPFLNDDPQRPSHLLCDAALLACEEYRCPAAALRHALERPYPYKIKSLAESAAGPFVPVFATEEAPCPPKGDPGSLCGCRSDLLASFHDGYALGVATHDRPGFSNTCGFFALCKRPLVRSWQDVAAIRAFLRNSEGEELRDAGRKLALMGDGCAMVLYSPLPQEAGQQPPSLCILIQNARHTVLEMRCGQRQLKGEERFTFSHAPLCLSFGNVYLALYPLMEDWCPVTLEKGAEDLRVLFSPSEGDPFAPLHEEKYGFVALFSNREEAGSFDVFCRQCQEYSLKDQLLPPAAPSMALERRVSFARGEVSLECAVYPSRGGVRFMRADGKALL